ncbi:MAG: rubrerythrin family protein [Dorea sp.]|jgi:bacterioferritin|nr:rubrerythrin family protein [Dorea sp.]
MEEKRKALLVNECDFKGLKPIMMDLPYPPIQVRERNTAYANLLGIDYCGAVSELSAITQYINNENRISAENCSVAKTILGIAMAEMIHLQKLGDLICLLGGNVDYTAKFQNGRQKMWTPEYIDIPSNIRKMIMADIEAEKQAVNQYKMHMKMINDDCVNAVLARIIKDEEYHIMILKAL